MTCLPRDEDDPSDDTDQANLEDELFEASLAFETGYALSPDEDDLEFDENT